MFGVRIGVESQTAISVVSPYGRVLQMAVIYSLDFNKNTLISFSKSVMNTAMTAMERFRSSIMDSLINEFRPHAQLNCQKKPSPPKRAELKLITKVLWNLYPSTKWIFYITQKITIDDIFLYPNLTLCYDFAHK